MFSDLIYNTVVILFLFPIFLWVKEKIKLRTKQIREMTEQNVEHSIPSGFILIQFTDNHETFSTKNNHETFWNNSC